MKKIFQEIWKLSSEYQEQDSNNHVTSVLAFARKLVKIKNANADIIIPSAILHDIGWSQVSEEVHNIIHDKRKKNSKEYFSARFKHQDEGVKLARQILNKINYSKELIEPILEIISQHDTRKEFISEEEGLTRDADKLSRYSKPEFWREVKISNYTAEQLYERLKKRIDETNFFYSKEAKQLAREEIENRKKELI
jgi:HD superfamily phosphodiesterase